MLFFKTAKYYNKNRSKMIKLVAIDYRSEKKATFYPKEGFLKAHSTAK